MASGKKTLGQQRAILGVSAAISITAAAGLWLLLLATPDLFAFREPTASVGFALQAIAVAALFGPLLAVEAVSHERLVTAGVDPLAGYTSRSFEFAQLFLRGSIEQWVLFAAGLLGLAATLPAGVANPAIMLATLIWIAGRLAFRIGYAFGPRYRGFGLCAHAQSLVILLFVGAKWGEAIAGAGGRIIVVGLFALAEVMLVLHAVAVGREERAAAIDDDGAAR